MSLSNFAEQLVLDWLFTNGSATRPTAWYMSLHTGDPGETGANEVAGNGYARQQCTATAGTNPILLPAVDETFTASGGNWGSVTHWGLWDAATTGNFLVGGSLTASKTVNDGDSAVAGADQMSVALD